MDCAIALESVTNHNGPRRQGCPALLAAVCGIFLPVALAGGRDRQPVPWGVYRQTISIPEPGGIAIDANHRFWVTSTADHQILVFGASGQKLREFGRRGSEPGEFLSPRGIVLAPDRSLYVVDGGNCRVQVLGGEGEYRFGWGQAGAAPGHFLDPHGIAVSEDRVFVADSGNHRVQVFDRQGGFLFAVGGYGNQPGRFVRPLAVAVDTEKDFYVADSQNHRVQSFAPDGKWQREWGGLGPHAGLFTTPAGIAAKGGVIFVADARIHRVQAFDRRGKFLYQWGGHVIRPHEGNGLLHYPGPLAVSPGDDGSEPLVAVCESFEDRCQVFGPATGSGTVEKPEWFGLQTESHYGPRCALDGGLLVVTQPDTSSVLVFDTSTPIPFLVTSFGGYGRSPGQFLQPDGVTVDAEHARIEVSDGGNRRLQTFRLALPDRRVFAPFITRFVRSIDTSSVDLGTQEGDGRPRAAVEPTALRRDENGNLYVLNSTPPQVLVLDATRALKKHWGERGGAPHALGLASDLALHPFLDRVYVVDSQKARVSVFAGSGKFLSNFGERGSSPGQLLAPFGIAFGTDASLFVTDRRRHRILKFRDDGSFVEEWGRKGIRAGEFFKPCGIAQASDGRVFVIDYGNHRGQILSAGGTFLEVFGSRWFTQPARSGR